jgi:hypothetical protein
MGRVMGKAARIVPANARMIGAARLLLLIGVGLALGACSKCDVPDFSHWGSSAPHACDSGTPSK